MSKILVTDTDNSWYDELSAIGYYYETEFEKVLANHISGIFPDYISIPLKYTFTSDVYTGTKVPDLLILRKDLSEWWITEVELSHHTVTHISEQVAVFSRPKFNAIDLSKYIYQKIAHHHPDETITQADIHNMITTTQQRVLVILDEPKLGLETALRPYGALLCVFQMFKDNMGRLAYRLEGEYPKVVHDFSHCRSFKLFGLSLEVINPDILSHITDRSEIEIYIRGKQSKWRKMASAQKTYLTFVGAQAYPLNDPDGYLLQVDTDSKFYLSKI